jgi:hypothetical protein
MAVSTTPTNPVVDESVVITESALIGETSVIEITSRPSLSTKELTYLTLDVEEVPNDIFEIVEAGIQTDTTTFDEAGEYGVTIYDIRVYDGAPSFPDDQSQKWYQLIASYTGTVYVSALMILPMLSELGDGATLQLAINNNTVRAATIVDATTEAARVAALQATVTAPLAALVGVTVASIGDTLQANVNDLRGNYEAHRVLVAGAVHAAADTTNVSTYTDSTSVEGAILVLNDIRDKLLKHMQDSSTAAVPWHTNDDLKNLPIAAAASDLGTATVLSADLRERAYELHRLQIAAPIVHGAADGGNALKAPGLVDNTIVAYFDALVVENPAVVAGEPDGAIDAEHRFGMQRTE